MQNCHTGSTVHHMSSILIFHHANHDCIKPRAKDLRQEVAVCSVSIARQDLALRAMSTERLLKDPKTS